MIRTVTLRLTAKQARVLWEMVAARVEMDHDSTKRGSRRGHHSARYVTMLAILHKLGGKESAVQPAHDQTEGTKLVKEVEQMYKGSFVPRGRLK